MTRSPRATQPRRWATLALASVTLAALPAHGEQRPASPINLANPDARLWLAQAQGGEAGEAGITAEAPTDAAYLAELAVVEGHMLAARDLYAKGQGEAAVELSLHPQLEGSLDALRHMIADHQMPDPAAALTAFTAALQQGADQAIVDAALTEVSRVFDADAAVEADQLRARFDAVVLLLKAAAEEYAAAIENGAVTDPMGWHEAHAFARLAEVRLQTLTPQPLTAKAAQRAILALQDLDAVFGDPMAAALRADDPQILFGVAARVELIASSVR